MAEHETAAPWKLPYPDPLGEFKLGATNFKELAERLTTILAEKLLIVKSYAAAAALKAGELAEQTKAGETFTLPAATTANQIIGVFCSATSCKITTSGGAFIIGDFITAASKTATITLLEGQHVVLQSNGTNWLIIAGEPKREAPYVLKSLSKAEGEGGAEPSATRPALVTFAAKQEENGGWVRLVVTIGGVTIGEATATGESEAAKINPTACVTIETLPGETWKATVTSAKGAPKLAVQTRLR
jgi:hypothetical protein